jgi:transposase
MIINHIIHKAMQTYPTNLTENQWKVIENILNDSRKRKHDLKEIFNAIFYLLKTGCQWRMLPIHFAPWNTVYYYYRQWKNNGLIEEIHEVLRNMVRKTAYPFRSSDFLVHLDNDKSRTISERFSRIP